MDFEKIYNWLEGCLVSTVTHGSSESSEPDFVGPEPSRTPRMLRPAEVHERTTLSSSHVHRLQCAGRFPRFVALGGRVCGLPEHVLDAFLAERMAARASMLPLGLRKPLPQWRFSMDRVPERRGIRLIRRSRVEELTGLPKSTFYPLIRQGLFPVQVPLGERAARWVAYEVEAWILDPPPMASRDRVAGGEGALPQLVDPWPG